jgi:integrase
MKSALQSIAARFAPASGSGRRQSGDRRKPQKIRLAEYAPSWVDSYRGRTTRGFSESTRTEYRRDVENLIVPYFEGYWLDDLDAGDVRDWFDWMEARGVFVSGIRKAKATLGAMLATAVEERKARFNPCLGVRYVPSQEVPLPRKFRPLTLAELARIREAVAPEWRLLFALLAHTGVRIGELLGLRWQHVHLGDDPCVEIAEQIYEGKRKGLKTANAYRTIPLASGMARALTSWRGSTEFAADDDPVFASQVGTPFSYSNLWNRVWKPARDAAKIPGEEVGAFHAFRRTLGSLIHDQGAKSDRQLSDWLGHHDPAFTVREYVGAMDDGLGDAEFLDELIPVDEWARAGQESTPEQPQNGAFENGAATHDDEGVSVKPEAAASAGAES